MIFPAPSHTTDGERSGSTTIERALSLVVERVVPKVAYQGTRLCHIGPMQRFLIEIDLLLVFIITVVFGRDRARRIFLHGRRALIESKSAKRCAIELLSTEHKQRTGRVQRVFGGSEAFGALPTKRNSEFEPSPLAEYQQAQRRCVRSPSVGVPPCQW